MPNPPPRPRTTTKEDLGFSRRKPTQWFSPPILARTAMKVIMSIALGEYLDKRELQQSLPAWVVKPGDDESPVWIDFVADTGDGFDPTYSVAWCVSQSHLRPAGHDEDLRRGDVLILGGDEVYPYATATQYDDRFRGPYTSALPWTTPGSAKAHLTDPHGSATAEEADDAAQLVNPCMFAIPGNHDWYDGLTGFMRLFAQPGWIGGRQVVQTRSYFALDLPGPYWLWAIDVQSDAYVDASQIDYFRAIADTRMHEGDRLILCTAKPSWADVAEEPDAYRNLAFVERELVPNGVTTVLMLSGDKHHYARYDSTHAGSSESARMRLTAGGGGAFLSATHKLAPSVEVPRPSQLSRTMTAMGNADKESFELHPPCYPDQRRSRRLALRALGVGWFNPAFLSLPALLYALLFVSNMLSLPSGGQPPFEAPSWGYSDLLLGRPAITSIVLVLVLWAMLAAFFDVPKHLHGLPAWLYRLGVGLVHAAAHVLVLGAIGLAAVSIFKGVHGALFMILAAVFVFVVGGLIGSVVFGVYLVSALAVLNRHVTETFSAFRYEGFKNFLRIQVRRDGITIYPIGIDKVCNTWKPDPVNPDPEASHLKPAVGTIAARLIEEPIAVR
jgi:hypothetical protein